MRFLPLILVFFLMACNRNESSVSEWRGPERSGIYNERNLLESWPEAGPDLIWELNDLGSGYGSPTIANSKIFVLASEDSISYLKAFDFNGSMLYKTKIGKEWVVNFPGSRSSPTIAGDFVYAMTGLGCLVCLKEKNGELVWSVDLLSDFLGESPRFGFSQSVVVDGNKVYCSPGGLIHNVVALDRFNGSVIWSSEGKQERPAYHPAKLIEVGKKKLYLTFSAYHFMGFNAETGKLLWAHEQINTKPEERSPGIGDTHANAVLFENKTIYYFEGDGNCAIALKLSDDGSEITQLWNNAAVDNYMGGIISLGDYLYSCGFSSNNLVKVDKQNGAVLESLPIGRGSIIAADNMLYYYNQKGEVHLIRIHPNGMQSVSNFTIEKGSREHFAHPVIHRGVLYVRHGEFLGAYQINKKR